MTEQFHTKIDILSATAEDYEEVMSISGGIYKGMDYLPFRYHEWLKDPQRRMFVARSGEKVVGFESFLLVDGGVTAVVEGLRVAPWIRGRGVAGIIQKFCFNFLCSDQPDVKRVCLTHVEDPPPTLLKKYTIVHAKAVISVLLPSDQLEGALKLLESRVDNLRRSKNHSVLEPSAVLKLFEGTMIGEELLPGGRLVQGWLPLTTHRANLELLLEWKITWIYSHPCDILVSSSDNTRGDTNTCQPSHEHSAISASPLTPSSLPTFTVQSIPTSAPPLSPMNASSIGFLSLGTPPYKVPLEEGMHCFDIDMFGNDPLCAKVHVLQQLKIGVQALPPGGSMVCFLYAEECLRAELSLLCQGLTPFNLMRKQLLLEMDI